MQSLEKSPLQEFREEEEAVARLNGVLELIDGLEHGRATPIEDAARLPAAHAVQRGVHRFRARAPLGGRVVWIRRFRGRSQNRGGSCAVPMMAISVIRNNLHAVHAPLGYVYMYAS